MVWLVVIIVALVCALLFVLYEWFRLGEERIAENEATRYLDPPGDITDLISSEDPDVIRGFEEMKRVRVAFVGVVRDSAQLLPINLLRLNFLGEYFAESRIFIYENDSTDSTPDILKACPFVESICEKSVNTNLPFICKQFDPERFVRMARARQKTVKWVREKGGHQTFDFVIMVDLDLVGGISLKGLATSFSSPLEWDAVFPNGLNITVNAPRYRARNGLRNYDPLALELFDGRRTKGEVPEAYEGPLIKERLRLSPENHDWIPVRSAFGGMSIYRVDMFEQVDYPEITLAGYPDCEHIMFHERARSLGFSKFYINPRMVLLR
jgi:hypothetical protein